MTAFYYYRNAVDASPNFTVDLGASAIRLGDVPGFTMKAEHLQSGDCQIIIDDPNANVGHSGDAILGNQRLVVKELACSVTHLYYGIITARKYGRGDDKRKSLRTGSSRQIVVELQDINAYLSARVIPQSNHAAIRPRETVDARIAWIMSTGYTALVHDNGLIASAGSKMCDKADYRGQRAVQVINDCEIAAGFGWNAFCYVDDTTAEVSLFFDNANTSTAYTSSLRISNVLSDVDTATAASFLTGTTFAPSIDAELTRDPTELGDSVYMPYRNGAVFVTRAATQAAYGQKDIIAPNANVGSKARATAIATDYAFQHSTEEDRITCTVELPASKVNLLLAGHRVQVKFSHLPGYESWTWCRVLSRSPGQAHETDDRYSVALELSPQEAGCTGTAGISVVQYALANSGASNILNFATTPTPGNLLICALGHRDEITLGPLPEPPPTGWTRVPLVGGAGTFVHARFAGATEYAHADLIYRVCQAGDVGIDTGTGSDPMKILMEWSGIGGPVSAGAAEVNAANSAAVSGTSGAPGIPALVLAAVITRLDDPSGTFTAATPGRIPTGTAALPTGSVGHDELAVLWTTTESAAATLTATQSGATIDGDGYWYGMRIAAFSAC